MTTIGEVKHAVRAWARAAVRDDITPIAFRDDPRNFELKLAARVELDGPMSIDQAGPDVVKYSPVPGDNLAQELDVIVVSRREASVMIRVVSRSHVGDTQSEQLLERLRAALKFPPTLRLLNEAGVAVLTIGQTARYGQVFDGRNESVSAFELRIGYIWSDEDPTWHPTIDTVGSAAVSGTVTDSGNGVIAVPEFTVTEPA